MFTWSLFVSGMLLVDSNLALVNGAARTVVVNHLSLELIARASRCLAVGFQRPATIVQHDEPWQGQITSTLFWKRKYLETLILLINVLMNIENKVNKHIWYHFIRTMFKLPNFQVHHDIIFYILCSENKLILKIRYSLKVRILNVH